MASEGYTVRAGVRQFYLITDTRELKPLYRDLGQYMKSSGGLRIPLGFLRVFFMRSALEEVPGAPRVQDHLPAEAIFQFQADPV